VFTNNGTIPEDQPTFLHALANSGYETVLCGRMHFLGMDQRHGFTKRIMDDITKTYWGGQKWFRAELQGYAGSLGEKGCQSVVGAGNSPVLAYDRAVICKAVEYLRKPHRKPQCLVVGTYAPHFPYVAPRRWYEYYLKNGDMPHNQKPNCIMHPATAHKEQPCSAERIRQFRAAYYGMISHMDSQIRQVYCAWDAWLQSEKRKGIFCYLSDHGDQIGERELYGKNSLFEGAVRVPVVFVGNEIMPGRTVEEPVSLLDISPTLCELGDAMPLQRQDGVSFAAALHGAVTQNRAVISEVVDEKNGIPIIGRMARNGKWKLIHYVGYDDYDMLFDVQNDPYETVNVALQNAKTVETLRKIIYNKWNILGIKDTYLYRKWQHSVLTKWGTANDVEREHWKVPTTAVRLPEQPEK
jgi:choline-sulfatase